MPHDCRGHEVNEGDVVVFYAKVKSVQQTEFACNATFEIQDPRVSETDNEYKPVISCNTGLCFLHIGDPRSHAPKLFDSPGVTIRWSECGQ